MLFVLNIDKLFIIYIILNNQINKEVIELVIFYSFIIRIDQYNSRILVIDTTREHEFPLLLRTYGHSLFIINVVSFLLILTHLKFDN